MRTWLSVGAGLVLAGPAGAFYFPGWPADGLLATPTLAGPSLPLWSPPLTSARAVRRQPDPDPFDEVEFVARPETVPEPATLVLAGLGLGAMWVRRRPGERPV